MLLVLFIWIYVAITCYILGFAILTGIAHFSTHSIKKANSYMMAGLVTATVYAQLFSLFYKVGLLANVILVIVCLFIIVILRKSLIGTLRQLKNEFTMGKVILFFVIIWVMAYGTSRGYMNYDTSLYHAQSIRWIEEYGIVPGLGNLHGRFGYNSSSFALSALYSFAFLGGQSFHCMAGFFSMLLALVCTKTLQMFKRRKPNLSDFVMVVSLLYIVATFGEIMSPASDFFAVITIYYIMIKWLLLLEEKETSIVPYALLSLLAVFAITLKLSAGFIVLLAIKPAFMLIRAKNYKGIITYIFLGILVLAPCLIRNVIISGWILYPSTLIDICNVDWKVPKALADGDAHSIKTWARQYYENGVLVLPETNWFKSWFLYQEKADRIYIIASMSASVLAVISGIVIVWKKKWDQLDWLLVSFVTNVSFYFWLFTAPAIRFGQAYVLMTFILVYGYFYLEIVRKHYVFLSLFCIFILVKANYVQSVIINNLDKGYWYLQQDYDDFEVTSYMVSEIEIYFPIEDDRTGYYNFPSSTYEVNIELRGESLKEGFRVGN